MTKFIWFVLLTLTTPVLAADPDCSKGSVQRRTTACMPVVLVVRHAEDTKEGPHALTDIGKNHANLYGSPENKAQGIEGMFDRYIFGSAYNFGMNKSLVCICPINRIISISNKIGGKTLTPRNPNPNPSSNPYETIKPLSKELGIPVMTDDTSVQYWTAYQWTPSVKRGLFNNQGNSYPYSVVIAWDKQGLNPTEEEYKQLLTYLDQSQPESKVPFKDFIPLLKALPAVPLEANSFVLNPLRTNLWVYSDQNAEGKFNNLSFYYQVFYDNKECQGERSSVPKLSSKCIKWQSAL